MADINKQIAKSYRRTKRAQANAEFKHKGGAPRGTSYIGAAGTGPKLAGGAIYGPWRETTVSDMSKVATRNNAVARRDRQAFKEKAWSESRAKKSK